MCLGRGLHADAGVRAGFVVEGDETGDALQCILVRLETLLTVDDLGLEYAVHTLGYGIIGWFVVLRHADSDAVSLQFVRIGVTAVLHASVRVMDESPEFIGRSL